MTHGPFTELTMWELKGTEMQKYRYDRKKERVLKIDSNGTVVKTLHFACQWNMFLCHVESLRFNEARYQQRPCL